MPDRRYGEPVTDPISGCQPDPPTTVGSGPSDAPVGTLAPSPPADASPSSNPWPSVGSAPSPTVTGSALLVYETWGDTGPNLVRLTVMADGSVVALQWIEPTLSEARVVRHLGTAGMAFVRNEIAKVGLDRSQSRKMITNPGCCGAGDAVTYRSEGGAVIVSRLLGPLGAYAPSAAWDRFDALVNDLADPEHWIPETSWVDPGLGPTPCGRVLPRHHPPVRLTGQPAPHSHRDGVAG